MPVPVNKHLKRYTIDVKIDTIKEILSELQ